MSTDDKQSRQSARKGWRRELREWVLSISMAVVIALLIQNYAFAQAEVRQSSMSGTLEEGHRLVEDKLSYVFSEPKRGDIVIIDGPESDVRLIKRLIALPGDTVDMREGLVYLNGVKLEESYAKGQTFPAGLNVPFTVEEGQVFVLGDNREHSLDSRQLGTISFESLEGKAVLRVWPLQKFGEIK
ncbi:signal peptidase I [Paenibacillus daejeonensis]|uniref:signal peptidase I n=1 Tax=Paenibacillus daejeonensis TaxID=135193 RepID=UPI0003804E7F|nr:signal peptidase I [Paenibacillus daejeonensis]